MFLSSHEVRMSLHKGQYNLYHVISWLDAVMNVSVSFFVFAFVIWMCLM